MVNTKLSVSLRILQLDTFQQALALKSRGGEMGTVRVVITRVRQQVPTELGVAPSVSAPRAGPHTAGPHCKFCLWQLYHLLQEPYN